MELQQVDRVDAQLLPDEVGIFKDVLCREYVGVFVLRQGGPLVVGGRNLGCGIDSLVRVAGHDVTQQSVALAFAISPRRIVKITTLADRELHGAERLGVIGATPAAHSPQSVGDVADFETGAAELAVFHDGVLWLGFVWRNDSDGTQQNISKTTVM